jgi:polyamine oxidase
MSLVPSPALRAVSSGWNTHPDFGGAYSFLRAGGKPEDRDALGSEVAPGLLLAGEYTWRDSPGTLHGAIFSGERAARRALAQPDDGDVIVIGAGIAGLAAARLLKTNGRRVLVLESGARYGGRAMSTDALGGDLPLGGAWLHGNIGHPLAALVQTRPATFDHIETYLHGVGMIDAATQARVDAQLDEIEMRLDALVAAAPDLTFADGLRAIPVTTADATERTIVDLWIRLRYENLMAAPLDQISVRHRSEPYHLPGGDHQIIGGLERALAHYAAGLDIRIGQRVRNMHYADGRWRVLTEAGLDVTVRTVICATPVTALRDGHIDIQPPLPNDTRARLSRIGFGPVTKTFCTFERAFWAPRLRFAITTSPAPVFEFFADVSALAGRPALCAFSVGAHAIAVERMSEREKCAVIDQVLAVADGDGGRRTAVDLRRANDTPDTAQRPSAVCRPPSVTPPAIAPMT